MFANKSRSRNPEPALNIVILFELLLIVAVTARTTVSTAEITSVTTWATVSSRAVSVTTGTTVSSAHRPPVLSCCLCIGGGQGGRSEVLFAITLSVADPDLDSQSTYLGIGYGQSIVDVGTECMEGRTAFLEHLVACHLGSADASAELHLDAFCADPHSIGNRHLDGPAI